MSEEQMVIMLFAALIGFMFPLCYFGWRSYKIKSEMFKRLVERYFK